MLFLHVSATDACTAKNLMNSGDTDEENDHTPDEILEIQTDIISSCDLPILRYGY